MTAVFCRLLLAYFTELVLTESNLLQIQTKPKRVEVGARLAMAQGESSVCQPLHVEGFAPSRCEMDLILPLQIDMADPSPDFDYRAVARLKSGMTIADANADVARMLPLYFEKYVPGNRMDPLRLELAVRTATMTVMSLLISIVGIHGVLAYAVMQRQREVGIRLALGAAPGIVTKMFVHRGLILAGVGIAFGAVIAAGLTRLMSSLLFGVAPIDVPTFLAAAGFLVAAVLLASFIPARRAGALEPAETLKGQ